MKLTIERSALLRSLGHISSVVERRNTIPILSNALMVAEGGELCLVATDMDVEITEAIAAQIESAGRITVPAHTLHDIVRKLPDGSQVEFSLNHDAPTLLVRSGRSRFTLGILPAEDFPVLSSGDLPAQFVMNAGDLKALIERTRFAISTEETRYYLNGIYLHTTQGDDNPMLRAVATDGHRLARVEVPAPVGAEQMPGIILPRKTVGEVFKLLEDDTAPVKIALSKTKVRFAVGSAVLTSKLIDGTFPDYERVIPSGNTRKMQVARKTLADATDRVATIATDKTRAIKLKLSADALELSVTSPDAGSATEEVEVVYQAPAMEIGFNSRYLLDIAQQIGGEVMEFSLADSASPAVLRDANDPSALYVLMPMRV